MRVTKPVEKYLNEVFGLDDPELAAIREAQERHKVEFMSISGAEARILQFLIRAFGLKRVVEVGTLFGYSALSMAKALPSDGFVVTVEYSPENFAIASKHFAEAKAGKRVIAMHGKGMDLLPSIETRGPFDMVFIDADKGSYVDYLTWAEKNVRKGGLIVGDNTFLFGGVYGEPQGRDVSENWVRVMREFNSRLADPSKYNSILIPTAQGITVAQKL